MAEPEDYVDPRRWLSLGVLLFASFMGVVDSFIVNVSAPSIERALHASFGQIQLVIASYTLAYGVGLVTGGRLGDIIGRKKMFQIGTAAFTATSLASALAPNPSVLIAFRVLQGLSAAAMLPQVISLIQVSFPSRERPRAFGIFGAVNGSSAVAGQVIGGLLLRANIANLGWRTVFLVNIPVGVLSLIVSSIVVSDRPGARGGRRPRLDIGGVALLGPAVFFVIYPLARESSDGWSLYSSLEVVLAAALFVSFWLYEARAEGRIDPLVPLHLFAVRSFRNGLFARAAFSAGASTMFLCLSFYLQQGIGFSPLSSAAIFVFLGAGYVSSSLITRRLLPRFWARIMVYAGLGQIVSLTFLALVVTMGGGRHLVLLVIALCLFGSMQGLISTSNNPIGLHGLQPADAGAASGVLLTTQTVFSSIGVAVIGTIYIGVVHAYGRGPFSGLARLHHYGHAFEVALEVMIGLTLALSAISATMPRSLKEADASSARDARVMQKVVH